MYPVRILQRGKVELFQGLNHGSQIVFDHADVGSLGSAEFAHGIGEERSPNRNLVPRLRATFDESQDGPIADGRFNEDGLDLSFGDEFDQIVDLPNAGFAFRADSLDGFDFDAVGPSPVMKCIVSRDENALGFGDRDDLGATTTIELIELFAVFGGGILQIGFTIREHLDKEGGHRFQTATPKTDIEPDVRIGEVIINF